ncbi:RhoGAP-domain-containing protein [Aureobasidium subglaciale]|nr:RhoGAP-domain-containing protein [Aureobasidium subglaciale]KAI5215867.1 RhoGAP-domain-containing protein [Aureobasidium subglaciale]KAI5219179.1 RhoGAP-domain-containing protein [Aureobasidium subglaciale]KAI5256621.1 RhoGAP-domain-containing protein [Aureobasidium subglaciale]
MDADNNSNYPESPMEEDEVFLCKGCGEGRAFELAGHRWHLGCFRCHSCATLLDSDANLLLLGDGSLICNNCTYSCDSCGNKIEDLAILTGEQAFCATCFKCRNCKRKIENLRYARTSQGIFCMNCHESLMARRRKRAKASKQIAAGASNPLVLDKSLPALPPSAVPQSALREASPSGSYSSDHLKASHDRKRDTSPMSMSDDSKKGSNRHLSHTSVLSDQTPDTLTLPASTYKQERASTMSSNTMTTMSDVDDGFLPMAYDPNPAPPPLPRRSHPESTPRMSDNLSPQGALSRSERNRPSSSRSVSTERDSIRSPGVTHADRTRQQGLRNVSGNSTPVTTPAVASPSSVTSQQRPRLPTTNSANFGLAPPEPFKLQDVPRDRRVSRNSPRVGKNSPTSLDTQTQSRHTPTDSNLSLSPASVDTPSSSINPFDDPKLREASSTAGPPAAKHPARGDSLPPATDKTHTSRVASPETTPALKQADAAHERKQSATSAQFVDAPSHPRTEAESTTASGIEVPMAPPRAANRPSAPSKSVANDDFIAPRLPPAPPATERPRAESVGNPQLDHNPAASPRVWRTHLPKHSAGEAFSMEEEMSRILRGDEQKRKENEHAGVLRRVSNAVKHGRSFSDKSIPLQKTPTISSADISSPILITSPISSPGQMDVASLKSQLRRAQQKIAELEADKLGLEEKMDTSADIKQVNTELREKRSTMAFLDTQREMVVRELEIMTEHLTRAKEDNKPLDISQLKSEILQDFAHSLQKLKDNLGSQIEDLVHKRNELTDDITNLIQVKDKGLQEFESLSSKNLQLAELNNQLVSGIQDMYKSHNVKNGSMDRSPLTNGLGIYNGSSRGDMTSLHSSSLQESSSLHDLMPHAADAEPATVLTAPQVVNIRKGQPKKFNWKKGSSGLAKNVTKGIKGAFAGSNDRGVPIKADGTYDITGMPYSQMQAGPGAIMGDQPLRTGDAKGFGFFSSGQKNGMKPPGTLGKNGSSSNLLAEPPSGKPSAIIVLSPQRANSSSVLFGSDLRERCDYEKRILPSIVTHCIEEVERRGMDMEGIYRKSGGSGQVKLIQQGFEKDGIYDIADPDLDIHAVTSALKQYFRKLPNPLITYETYDPLLEAAQITEKEKQIAGIKAALEAMPQAHHDVLEYLVQHLCRVVKQESENLMTPLNLSVVFAPTILRPLSIEREMSDMQAQRMAVQALLEHADAIFEN